jgi:hypothetical protein
MVPLGEFDICTRSVAETRERERLKDEFSKMAR